MNFYGALFVIVVLGLALTVYSRYEYQNPTRAHASSGPAPAIGSTLYAALSVQACGTPLAYLPSDTTARAGFRIGADDVVRLSPLSSADAGANATLATMALEYPGLIATSSELAVPNARHLVDPATTFKNGDVCTSSSKYPGKKGKVVYAYWTSFGQKSPTLTTSPASIKFVKDLRVTMAFEPAGVTPTAPSQATVDQMVLDATAAATPTTTTPTSSTTAPVSSTTTHSNTTPSTTSSTGSTTTTSKG